MPRFCFQGLAPAPGDLMNAHRWIAVLLTWTLLAAVGRAQTLLPGNPPLTQDMVSEYCDFMDWHLDRPRVGAWPAEAVKQLITSDWRKANAAGRDAFLDDITWWKEVFPKVKFAGQKDARLKRPSAY